ncbi:hypothetical protein HN789_00485 [archaeon]|jgi:hypothetical protein|nr:hypothetical protein [archaeon]MBT4023203.1 hypothetical protein [archaeon]MBT4272409.1 hypothetical protein [archaeon]MBT4460972.1 hypothetical protein [archaeon]MBT4859114.1 hypothetical protein [archaeon]
MGQGKDRFAWKNSPGMFWYLYDRSAEQALTSIVQDLENRYSPYRDDRELGVAHFFNGQRYLNRPHINKFNVGDVYSLFISQKILDYEHERDLGREDIGKIVIKRVKGKVDASSPDRRRAQYGFSVGFYFNSKLEGIAERDFFVK